MGTTKTGWWFGTSILFSHKNWEFLIIPIDEVIFFRGVQTNHQAEKTQKSILSTAPGAELQGTATSERVEQLEERLSKAGAGGLGVFPWWKTLGKTLKTLKEHGEFAKFNGSNGIEFLQFFLFDDSLVDNSNN